MDAPPPLWGWTRTWKRGAHDDAHGAAGSDRSRDAQGSVVLYSVEDETIELAGCPMHQKLALGLDDMVVRRRRPSDARRTPTSPRSPGVPHGGQKPRNDYSGRASLGSPRFSPPRARLCLRGKRELGLHARQNPRRTFQGRSAGRGHLQRPSFTSSPSRPGVVPPRLARPSMASSWSWSCETT